MEWWRRHSSSRAAARAVARLGRAGGPRQQAARLAGNESLLGGGKGCPRQRVGSVAGASGGIGGGTSPSAHSTRCQISRGSKWTMIAGEKHQECADRIHADAGIHRGQLRDLDQRDEDAEHHHLDHRPGLHDVGPAQHLADPVRRRRPPHREQDRQHEQDVACGGDHRAECDDHGRDHLALHPHLVRAADDRRARAAPDGREPHQRCRIGDDEHDRGGDRERQRAGRADRMAGWRESSRTAGSAPSRPAGAAACAGANRNRGRQPFPRAVSGRLKRILHIGTRAAAVDIILPS